MVPAAPQPPRSHLTVHPSTTHRGQPRQRDSTSEDSALEIESTTAGQRPDTDGNPLTVTGVGGATGGTVALANGVVTFTPTTDYHGPASFTYTITDSTGATAVATVSITVTPTNDAPGGQSRQRLHTPEDTAVEIDVNDLLDNDTDIDGNPLTDTESEALPAEPSDSPTASSPSPRPRITRGQPRSPTPSPTAPAAPHRHRLPDRHPRQRRTGRQLRQRLHHTRRDRRRDRRQRPTRQRHRPRRQPIDRDRRRRRARAEPSRSLTVSSRSRQQRTITGQLRSHTRSAKRWRHRSRHRLPHRHTNKRRAGGQPRFRLHHTGRQGSRHRRRRPTHQRHRHRRQPPDRHWSRWCHRRHRRVGPMHSDVHPDSGLSRPGLVHVHDQRRRRRYLNRHRLADGQLCQRRANR